MPRRLTAALWMPIATAGNTINQGIHFPSVRFGPGEKPSDRECDEDNQLEDEGRRDAGRPGGALLVTPEDRCSRTDARYESRKSDDRSQRRLPFRLAQRQAEQYRVPGHVRHEDLAEPQVANRVHASGSQ